MSEGMDFPAVLEAELDAIKERRGEKKPPAQPTQEKPDEPVSQQARNMDMLGLALSGGGVRSATFNLGILQGLAKRNWLGKVDYLSTVSGGGFIGAWLSNLARKETDFVDVIRKTVDDPKARGRIDNLRRMGNYLTPTIGVMSKDTRVAVTTYVRNLACNLAIIVLSMTLLILAFRLLDVASGPLPNQLLPVFICLIPVSILAPTMLVSLVLRSRTDQLSRNAKALEWFAAGLVIFALMVGIVLEFFTTTPWSSLDNHSKVWGPLIIPTLVVVLVLLVSAVTSRWPRCLPHVTEPAATLMLAAGAWLVCSTVSLYAGTIVDGMQALVATIWAGGTLIGILIDRLPKLGPKVTSVLRRVAMVTPYVFVLGLFVLVSLGVEWGIEELLGQAPNFLPLLGISLIVALFGFVWAWLININEFSLHAFYRDRIADAYLGGKPEQDVLVEHLSRGPYHLINTTLNLSADGQLGWQERKGASFVITPSHWGYDAGLVSRERGGEETNPGKNGYRNLKGTGVRLRTAVTLSGAAASPNMGNYSSPALAMLLTLFNVRLGCWFPNPLRKEASEHAPPFALTKLVAELLGYSRSKTRYVHLSDGGHFENLGIYELVRRRCGVIIACDAGTDPELGLSDLGAAIRLCRIDFGVEINIDTSSITTRGSANRSSAHCAMGTIMYGPDEDGATTTPGILVYIKASLTGDEPSDILDYATRHLEFPHEPLADQFFGESQFESYRRLGLHIAESIFPQQAEVWRVAEAITDMREAWTPPSSIASEVFAHHGERLQHLFDELREDRDLDFLAAQIYVEWNTVVRYKTAPALPMPNQDQLAKGFSLCSSAIQLMESVYLELRLQQTHQHPDHQGWMNLFRHWGWSPMFQLTWTATASTFGARFRNFSETRFQFRSRKPLEQVSRSIFNSLELELEKQIMQTKSEARVIPLGLELAPTDDNAMLMKSATFGVGLAVILGKQLVFLRIRDHLRASGLAKQAIVFLKTTYAIEGLNSESIDVDTRDTPDREAIHAEFVALDAPRFERMATAVLRHG